LDIDNKEVLENALIDYEGTILFVSHDRYFINRVATKVLELSEEGSRLYLGDYDYYLEKKQEELELAEHLSRVEAEKNGEPVVDETVTETKKNFILNKEQQKLQRQITRRIEKAEADLAEVDETIENLQLAMADPTNSSDHSKLSELQKQIEVLETKQEALMEDWENASLELEELD
jgi:ATP-binding cassette subfamily F protein 3